MEEVGLQEWRGFVEKESKIFQVRGTENTPRAEHKPEYFHGTGWKCEQVQLWFIWGPLGKWPYLYGTMPAVATVSFISYRCLTEKFCKTLAHTDLLGPSVDLGKLLLICKYLLHYSLLMTHGVYG